VNQDAPKHDFEALLEYLKANRGFDFTGYKRASLMRRVLRRMSELPGIDTFAAYQDHLEVHPEEFVALFNTILINVTGFFRDAPAWDHIAREVVPRIIEGRRNGDPIRVCCVGCASGEEPYTVAMLFAEALDGAQLQDHIKIYATDVDDDALTHARRGIYSERSIEAVPPKLRQKYFEPAVVDHLQVRPELRRAVIFGRHDLMHDAPISKLDLLVCRNTLMYFNAESQARIIARFHYALGDDRFLFLGRSEMLLSHATLFAPVDLKYRIFSKIAKPNLRDRVTALIQLGGGDAGHRAEPDQELQLRELAFDAVPTAQLVINLKGDLVSASAKARRLFGIDTSDVGRPLQDLEISYRPVELRSLIERALTEQKPLTLTSNRSTIDGVSQALAVEVAPLHHRDRSVAGVAISFTETTQYQRLQEELRRANEALERTNEELSSTNEELQTTNEELQSTNEELETTNEELQSTNEELQTMNEELQSTNEELETTNEELRIRTDELDEANTFLRAILGSLRLGVAVIDGDRFLVRAWNDKAADLWGVQSNQVVGQSIFNLDIGLPTDSLKPMIREVVFGDTDSRDLLVDATNRRGKAIRCRVTCTPVHASTGERRGTLLLMEEME